MESLELSKPLIVVINDQLMHNHQVELARQLQSDRHLLFTTCRYAVLLKNLINSLSNISHLQDTVEHMDVTSLVPYTRGNPHSFGSYLDSVVGFK